MSTIEHRLALLERRVALIIEGMAGRSYVCAGCGERQAENYFFYEAMRKTTGVKTGPLCAPCVRGRYAAICTAEYRHLGPFKQSELPAATAARESEAGL